MSKFVVLYQGGDAPQTAEEGEKVMADWMTWFGSAGTAVLDPGNAFGAGSAIGAGSPSAVNGYTLIEAESLDAALAFVGDHPHLAAHGRIEVHATNEM